MQTCLAITLFLLTLLSSAWAANSSMPKSEHINQIIDRGLKYLERSQVKITIGTAQFEGEWDSTMVNQKAFLHNILGPVGYQASDSNCFAPLVIHNILGELYLRHGLEDQRIPPILDLAMKAIMDCYNSGTFNFWHQVPLDEKFLKKGERAPLLRNPNHFDLRSAWFHSFANIVNDADDTAAGFLALKLQQELHAKLGTQAPYEMPPAVGCFFAFYRDTRRGNIHLYDVLHRRPVNTGAYLTWFGKEAPISGPWILSNKKSGGIPLNTNDVDCVVNANVLGTLAKYNELETTEGVAQTCRYLNRVAKNKHHLKYCASYYPNIYNTVYAFAQAYARGVSCLENSRSTLIKKLLKEQKKDGGFDAYKDHRDRIHSTAFAVNALLDYYAHEQLPRRVEQTVLRGVNFLLGEIRHQDEVSYWPGGIFFSAGSVLRDHIYWKTQALTTALVVKILVKIKNRRLTQGDL